MFGNIINVSTIRSRKCLRAYETRSSYIKFIQTEKEKDLYMSIYTGITKGKAETEGGED